MTAELHNLLLALAAHAALMIMTFGVWWWDGPDHIRLAVMVLLVWATGAIVIMGVASRMLWNHARQPLDTTSSS